MDCEARGCAEEARRKPAAPRLKGPIGDCTGRMRALTTLRTATPTPHRERVCATRVAPCGGLRYAPPPVPRCLPTGADCDAGPGSTSRGGQSRPGPLAAGGDGAAGRRIRPGNLNPPRRPRGSDRRAGGSSLARAARSHCQPLRDGPCRRRPHTGPRPFRWQASSRQIGDSLVKGGKRWGTLIFADLR